MKTAGLATEMRHALRSLVRSGVEELIRLLLGVPAVLISHFQMVGLARVREYRGMLYEPDQNGRWAYITPVCVQYPDTPESTHPDLYRLVGNLIDLVAWDEQLPNQWRSRVGAASWLGAIEPQHCNPEPVRVWSSILSWFRANCRGLVILTRERPEIFRLLAGCVEIHAEDEEHATELRNILAHPFRMPPVYGVAREVRRAA
jgi:hypothetical protein